MTNYTKIKKMSPEELAEFFSASDCWEDFPWTKWFNTNFCDKCETITRYVPEFKRETRCAYCEINNRCFFFDDEEEVPDSKKIIKLWLESEEDA